MKIQLRNVASVIRSKNAGPYELTLDILLKEEDMFQKMREADIINRETIMQLYHVKAEDVLSIVYFPGAKAIKATIVRPNASGALGERDVYGAQQHAPLMNFAFEIE